MMGFCQSANASQCRHVDRLVMADEKLTTWETSNEPVWELTTGSNSAVRSSDCHDEAILTGSAGLHPMIWGESTFVLISSHEKPVYPPFIDESFDHLESTLDPRPPRI